MRLDPRSTCVVHRFFWNMGCEVSRSWPFDLGLIDVGLAVCSGRFAVAVCGVDR